MLSSPGDSELEDVEDALVDGDVAYQRGTAAAALRHRDFRIVYAGTFSSNVGTWMQNVILGEYALQLTHSGFFVGLLFFGQLGPLLFLSMMGAMRLLGMSWNVFNIAAVMLLSLLLYGLRTDRPRPAAIPAPASASAPLPAPQASASAEPATTPRTSSPMQVPSST